MRKEHAERLARRVPDRVVSGVRALVGAMNDSEYTSEDALVADLRAVIDDRDDEHWGMRRREWGAFRRLDELSAWIARLAEALAAGGRGGHRGWLNDNDA